MNIQQYPLFRPLELSDKPVFDKAFKSHPPEISEFTFTNLYAWRESYRMNVSTIGGMIILRSDKNGEPQFFNPIGSGDTRAAIIRIIGDTHGVFIRMPEAAVKLFALDSRFSVQHDENNSDYLFKTGDLVALAGKKYDGKRNHIRKFRFTHPYEYIILDGSSAAGCLSFEEAWCSIKDCDSVESLANERRAIREMISHFADFCLIGGAIKIDDRMAAVAIAEKLNPDTLVMHVLKADPGIDGLQETMFQEFLSRHGGGFTYVNLEQDLGVEGLRRSKLSYHPLAMVKKYTLG